MPYALRVRRHCATGTKNSVLVQTKTIHPVNRVLAIVAAAFAGLGALATLALLVVVNLDVGMRSFLNRPLPAIPELVALSITGIVFLQAPSALLAGRFIKSDALAKLILAQRPRLHPWFAGMFGLAGAALFGCIAYASWPILTKAWSRGDYVGTLGVITFPTWPISLIVVLGSLTCAAIYLRSITWKESQP